MTQPSPTNRAFTQARLLTLGLMLWIFAALPANAQLTTLSGAPEGFEHLTAPRETVVTVFYGGEQLDNYPAHFTPSSISFDAPQAIIEAIPTIIDKAKVAALLGADMPSNAGLVCQGVYAKEGCGTLKPNIVGVIFDENKLRAELFFAATALNVTDDMAAKYLPLPERKFSAVHGFNGAVNGSNADTTNYSLSMNSIYSYGEGRFASSTSYAKDGARFDSAVAVLERKGIEMRGGLFRSRAQLLAGDRDIGGVSFATSERTVLDSHKTEGNDIIIHLARRSFVSISREGRLYSSRAYEAGNQRLDTTDLPDGAYTIKIKIEESGGAVREETRFFAKTQDIPPVGRPSYYAEMGMVRKQAQEDALVPMLTSRPIARFGTGRRVNANTGASVGMLAIQNRAAVEATVYRLEPKIKMRLSGMASTAGDAGASASFLYTSDVFSADLELLGAWLGDDVDHDYEGIFSAQSQANLNLSYAVRPDITLSARAGYATQPDMDAIYSFGPALEWRIWQVGENSWSFNTDVTRTERGTEANAGIRFSRKIGGNFNVSGTSGAHAGGERRGPSGSVHGTYSRHTPGQRLEAGLGSSVDGASRIVNGDVNWDNSFGQVHGSAQKTLGDGFAYGGNFMFNAAQLGLSTRVGGTDADGSAVIVSATGEADAVMKIMLNGSDVGRVRVGETQTLFLSPFRTYHVSLIPETMGLFAYDTADRMVTLYPGNVARQEWQVNDLYVVAAQIVSPDGTPLANATLEGENDMIATNEGGWLQAEMTKPQAMTFKMADGTQCTAQPPADVKAKSERIYIYNDPIVCKGDKVASVAAIAPAAGDTGDVNRTVFRLSRRHSTQNTSQAHPSADQASVPVLRIRE